MTDELPAKPNATPLPATHPAPRLKPIDRTQSELRPFALDDLIDVAHPARGIWEFLGHVELSGFKEDILAVEGRAGQATWDPRLLVALWLYGYSRGMGSAREISRSCEHEPGLRWLCGDRPVNYHTLSDFRVKHAEALRGLMIDVLAVLSHEGLIGLEQVAHDGTRVRAVASSGSFHRQATIDEHLAAAKAQVEAVEKEAAEESSSGRKAARERAAEQRRQRLEAARQKLQELQANKVDKEKAQVRVSESEPEARIMKMADGGFAPAYNAQVSTDGRAGIIIQAELSTMGSDYPHLVPAVDQIREDFGRVPDQVLSDGGFVSRENIIALDGKTDLIGPYDEEGKNSEEQRKRQGISEAFAVSMFLYDPVRNQLVCPAQKRLVQISRRSRVGRMEYTYQGAARECGACVHKAQCCPKTASRSVLRLVEDQAVERHRRKMQSEAVKLLYKKRAEIAEFPFCWIKEKFGFRRFHVRGLSKARLELWWITLAYNVQQWLRVTWSAAGAI